MKSKFEKLDITKISKVLGNTRNSIDNEKLIELSRSISAQGLINPLTVRKVNDEYQLISGFRRLAACELIGMVEVEVHVIRAFDNDVKALQIIENCQRVDIHPMDECEAFQKLLDDKNLGWSIQDIANNIGKTDSFIWKRLSFSRLTPNAKMAFLNYHIKITHAIQLVKLTPKDQEKALKYLLISDSEGNIIDAYSTTILKDYIKDHIELSLLDAVFDIDDKKLTKAGSCSVCPKRSGVNTNLFNDVESADICFDSVCFHDKEEAAQKNMRIKLIKEGHTVDEGVFPVNSYLDVVSEANDNICSSKRIVIGVDETGLVPVRRCHLDGCRCVESSEAPKGVIVGGDLRIPEFHDENGHVKHDATFTDTKTAHTWSVQIGNKVIDRIVDRVVLNPQKVTKDKQGKISLMANKPMMVLNAHYMYCKITLDQQKNLAKSYKWSLKHSGKKQKMTELNYMDWFEVNMLSMSEVQVQEMINILTLMFYRNNLVGVHGKSLLSDLAAVYGFDFNELEAGFISELKKEQK